MVHYCRALQEFNINCMKQLIFLGPLYFLCYKMSHNVAPVKANEPFVCFVTLRPKSTAMIIAGRSVQLTTPFPGQA